MSVWCFLLFQGQKNRTIMNKHQFHSDTPGTERWPRWSRWNEAVLFCGASQRSQAAKDFSCVRTNPPVTNTRMNMKSESKSAAAKAEHVWGGGRAGGCQNSPVNPKHRRLFLRVSRFVQLTTQQAILCVWSLHERLQKEQPWWRGEALWLHVSWRPRDKTVS